MIILLQAADGESQPSTDVDLFVSTEKVMVLNTDLQVCLLLSYLSAYGTTTLFLVKIVKPASRRFVL